MWGADAQGGCGAWGVGLVLSLEGQADCGQVERKAIRTEEVQCVGAQTLSLKLIPGGSAESLQTH